jgi:two-component system chemotaxis response regulator CheY
MKRCMIVDESSVIRTVANRILASENKVVVEAGSAREALDRCVYEMPDIILVSSKLADMSAVDFIRSVMGGHFKPHVILCLTEMDIGATMRAKRAGAQGYLLKPFNRAQLLKRMSRSFGGSPAVAASTAA